MGTLIVKRLSLYNLEYVSIHWRLLTENTLTAEVNTSWDAYITQHDHSQCFYLFH